MENNQLTIIKQDGTEELCEILFTHFNEDLNKNYVAFIVLSTGECTAMSFVEKEDGTLGDLFPIESEEEWDEIEEIFEKFADEMDEEDEDGCGCGDDCDCESDNGSCCGGCNH